MSKIFRSLFLAITLTLLFSANALAGPVDEGNFLRD